MLDVGLGIGITVPSFGDDPPIELEAASVIAAALASALAGWALLVVVERRFDRPRVMWTTAGVAVTMLSLGGPLSGSGVTPRDRFLLAALHVLVAAIYIPWMRRTIGERKTVAS
jgi:hypothetical protein